MNSTPHRDREYAKAVGARLRAIRVQQGLSLQSVEQKSRGRWKTAAVGSYERGDRMVGVAAAAELAAFYGAPVAAALLDGTDTASVETRRPLTLDLQALDKTAATPGDHPALRALATWALGGGDSDGEPVEPVATTTLGDHADGRLTLRGEHEPFLAALAVLAGVDRAGLDMLMREVWRILADDRDGQDGPAGDGEDEM